MDVKLRVACLIAAAFALAARESVSIQGAMPAPAQTASAAAPGGAEATPESARALVTGFCVPCHNDRARTGGLTLQPLSLEDVASGAETWEKVIRKLRGGMMPPPTATRPDQASIDQLVAYLEHSIDRAALAHPNPGRSPIHRLNRTEYANAVRDVLGLEIDPAAYLPADDEANGFDNIADVLRVSPSLLEQYLAASRKIAALAVGDLSIAPSSAVYRVPPDRAQGDHIEGLPLGTRGGTLIRHVFPLDADYEFRVNLLQNIVGYVPGLEWPHVLEIAIDGERVFAAPVGGEEDNRLSDTNLAAAKEALDRRLRTRVHVTAGPHTVTVAFVKKSSAESVEPLQPFTRDHDMQNMNGIPLVEHVQISGPFNPTGPGDTPSRRTIFVCRPPAEAAAAPAARAGRTAQGGRPGGARSSASAAAAGELACARRILATLARRAYRRPVDTDLDTLLGFYEAGRRGGTFDTGIERAIRFILASPKFLFRDEPDPPQVAPGSVYRTSDLELASRLSFFLWSSVPDDQLLAAALEGRLADPAALDRQVKRMLADPKAKALVTSFADQWLFVRNLQSVQPDTQTFPNFDDNLRQAFRTETELFVESILREDRSVLDLLTADYTFVNERLARHYGIPNVSGTRFRRVTIPDENRRGLLGEGTILAVTSYPNRTSPVLRGKWILENILGTPPPPPPPNVPALKDGGDGGRVMTVRERLEEHRRNPACASCHRIMDPLGFSLENFDATGAWRTKETPEVPVDASGQLADGTPVDGPVALRRAILRHPEQFVRTLTEKLLTYALGRQLEYYDMPVVRSIEREAARQNYRFSAIVSGIVRSVPFRMKRAAEAAPAAAAGH